MISDSTTQAERQLWAAYPLILSWPKREVVRTLASETDGNQTVAATPATTQEVPHGD
jgi:hypothetical protein